MISVIPHGIDLYLYSVAYLTVDTSLLGFDPAREVRLITDEQCDRGD